MFPRYFSSHVAFVLLIAVIWGRGSSGTNTGDLDKANKLVNEGNAAVDSVKKFFEEADSKKEQMMHTDRRHVAEARIRAAEAIAPMTGPRRNAKRPRPNMTKPAV